MLPQWPARELGDAAPLASSVTRAVNIQRAAGVDFDAFAEAMYHARAVTKERWAAVRKESKKPGDAFPRKQAMGFFFAELEYTLGLRELPETREEYDTRRTAEEAEKRAQRGRGQHPEVVSGGATRKWVQTYRRGEGLPNL